MLESPLTAWLSAVAWQLGVLLLCGYVATYSIFFVRGARSGDAGAWRFVLQTMLATERPVIGSGALLIAAHLYFSLASGGGVHAGVCLGLLTASGLVWNFQLRPLQQKLLALSEKGVAADAPEATRLFRRWVVLGLSTYGLLLALVGLAVSP